MAEFHHSNVMIKPYCQACVFFFGKGWERFSESPFCCHCRQSIKAVVFSPLVPDEVVAQFNLAAEAQIDALHAFQCVEIKPELRLTQHDKLAIHIGIVPQVAETAEGAKPMCECHSPHFGQLEAAERMCTIVSVFEIILVHGLHGECL